MAKEINMMAKVGSWAFIIGVALAVIVGLLSPGAIGDTALTVLIVLGLIVGFLNVTGRETTPFLLAGVALVIVTSKNLGASSLTDVTTIGMYLQGILGAITAFVIPAVIIVALKAIWALAHDE